MKTPIDHHHIVPKALNNEALHNEVLNSQTLNNVILTRMDIVLSPWNKRPCYADSLVLN